MTGESSPRDRDKCAVRCRKHRCDGRPIAVCGRGCINAVELCKTTDPGEERVRSGFRGKCPTVEGRSEHEQRYAASIRGESYEVPQGVTALVVTRQRRPAW